MNRARGVIPLGLLLQGIVGLGDVGRRPLSLAAITACNRDVRVDFGPLREMTRLHVFPLAAEAVGVTQLIVRSLSWGWIRSRCA